MTNALGSNEIRSMLDRGDLVVMPLLDLNRQIGRASLDVRLGQDFVLFRKGQNTRYGCKDAFNDTAWVDYYDRIRREYGQAFILHRAVRLKFNLGVLTSASKRDGLCHRQILVGKSRTCNRHGNIR